MAGNESGFATPRVAAGALFADDRGRILLVRKTYGNRWDIPGGCVDRGESPAEACGRELREELGIERSPRGVLVTDWAPVEAEGDKILWVFDCGALGEDEKRLRLDFEEIDHWAWVAVDEVDAYAIPRLARRLKQAHMAREHGRTLYLEHGRPTF